MPTSRKQQRKICKKRTPKIMNNSDCKGLLLPPLPKLRRRPGLSKVGERQSDQNLISPPKKRKISVEDYKHHRQSPSEEDAQTSRLLTKSECGRGGGRSKKSSLIHSIPKFTEVVPNGNQEIKQLLQGRLVSKQQLSKQLPGSSISVTVVDEAPTSHSLNSSTAVCNNEGKQVISFVHFPLFVSIYFLNIICLGNYVYYGGINRMYSIAVPSQPLE